MLWNDQQHRHLQEELDGLEALKAMRHVRSRYDALPHPEHFIILISVKEAQYALT